MRKDNIDKFLLNTILGIVKEDTGTDIKLIRILLIIESRITQMLGKADTDLANFITDVRKGIRPMIIQPSDIYRDKDCYKIGTYKPYRHNWSTKPIKTDYNDDCVKDNEIKSYSNKWNSAYRIGSKEPEKDRFITNKELAMWLSKGNGQMMCESNEMIILTCTYDYSTSSGSEIPYMDIKVRKWEDEEWHDPTYNYCFREGK